ncbi:hypothetical protein QJU23_10770, partial [Pasteurella atlantica]
DGQKGTDTVYADLSDWTKSVTIKNGTMDVKQAEGNSLKFTNMERLLIKTGSGNDVIDNTVNDTDDYIDTGAGNDKITLSTIGNSTSQISGGSGIDMLKLDYSKNDISWNGSRGLEHYFYVDSSEKKLNWDSAFTDISTNLAKNNTKHQYYNHHNNSSNYINNHIYDDLSIENQEIIGTQESDLFIHNKGYSSVFDGQKYTDTVYADLSDWTKSVTIKDGSADVKQAEGN